MLALARAKAYAREVQAIEISDGISVIGKESVRATALADVAHHTAAREYFYSLTGGNIVGVTAASFACRRFRSRLIIRRF